MGKNLKKSPLKLLGQLGQNFDGMVIMWFPFRTMTAISRHSFNIRPYGKNVLKSLLRLLSQLRQNFDHMFLFRFPSLLSLTTLMNI